MTETAARCPEWHPRQVGRQCQKAAGHDGAHLHIGNHSTVVWGWREETP